MINPHGMVRQALCAQLKGVASLEAVDVCTDARNCQASVPLAWHTRMPAPEALRRALSGPAPRLFGAPLIQEAYLSGGHACFLFTEAAYGAIMAHIIAGTQIPPLPDPARGEADYAVARMLMLARKGGEGCPADKRTREALWLAMGILDAGGARREARRLRAARAFTGLLRGRPPQERWQLAQALGPAADCAARLLSYNAIET